MPAKRQNDSRGASTVQDARKKARMSVMDVIVMDGPA